MKSISIACLMLVGALGHASYDLMMIPDADGAVQRFDPISGASLGSFARGAAATAVDYNSTSGNTYVMSDPGRLYTYNHSTGIRTFASFTLATMDILATESTSTYGWTYATGQTYLTRYNLTGGRVDATLPAGVVSISRIMRTSLSSKMLAIGTNTGGDMIGFTFNSTSNSVSGETVTTLIPASGLLAGQVFGQPVRFDGDSYTLMYRSNTSELKRMNVIMNASGALTAPSSNSVSSSLQLPAGVLPNLLPAHDGYYALLPTIGDSTLLSVAEFDNTARYMGTINTSIKIRTGTWNASIILAPEPATYAVMTVGLFAVCRRRRSR
jgi:hypothetical protein